MKTMEGTFVETQTPTKIFGAGGLYRQRVYSWDYVVLKFIDIYVKLLIMGSPLENFTMKMFILHELWTIFVDIQRIPIVIYVLYNEPYRVLGFLLFVSIINILFCFWFNYVTIYEFPHKSSIWSVLLMPFYKLLVLYFRIIGELKYLIRYKSTRMRYPHLIQNLPDLPNIMNQEKDTDIKNLDWDKIWSDPDYLIRLFNLNTYNIDTEMLELDIKIDNLKNNI